jgi:sugar lactone lactonase YvrE
MPFGRLVVTILATWIMAFTPVMAGYEPACFIDGAQSHDGRYVVTAESVGKIANHGPNQWKFIWKDTKVGETRTFPARSVSGGQVHAQLYVAPDGATFALFNHVTLWYPGKSDMHGAAKLWGEKAGVPQDVRHEAFSRRIVIYKNDGAVIKELGICDLLTSDELDAVTTVFTRVNWIDNFPGLSYRQTARPAYALCLVSPDYTVLEVRAVAPRGTKTNRTIRISLTDGRILDAQEPLPESRLPVRSFVDPDHLPDNEPKTRDSFLPSLDPVRVAGKLIWSAPPPPVELKLLKGGFRKLDTPAWLPSEKAVIFTDLDAQKLYKLDPAQGTFTDLRSEAARGRIGVDRRFYGVLGNKLAAWSFEKEPKPILAKEHSSKEVSLNDLALTQGLVYFTTLKDPERGRLTVVDLKTQTATVAFDGIEYPDLSNPNGVAVSADGKFLFVAISNYKDRKKAGLYRFPLRADGSLDVAAGKAKAWAKASAPDGVAVAPDGSVCVTDGNVIRVFNDGGIEIHAIRIPAGSGTNLTFGGEDGRTLFVTTAQAIYAGRWNGTASTSRSVQDAK